MNSILLQGPDLTNNLVDVILKFREECVAVMGDIESMFYQARVPKEDCDCLRFLWFPNGDINQRPVVYRMLVHLFGASSSPSCANFALRQTALDHRDEYRPEIVECIQKHFYVDDFLKSVATEDEAIQLIPDISELCEKGGFHLTKWVSNCHEVLDSVPVAERAKDLRTLDLECESLPTERALGVLWTMEGDTLGFKVNISLY